MVCGSWIWNLDLPWNHRWSLSVICFFVGYKSFNISHSHLNLLMRSLFVNNIVTTYTLPEAYIYIYIIYIIYTYNDILYISHITVASFDCQMCENTSCNEAPANMQTKMKPPPKVERGGRMNLEERRFEKKTWNPWNRLSLSLGIHLSSPKLSEW